MADSLNLSSFSTSLTDFARDNQAHIFNRLLIPGLDAVPGSPIPAVSDYMTFIPGNDEVVLTDVIVSDVLQPGGKDTFDPKANAVAFKNRVAKVRPCKVDLEFTHTKIMMMYKSYLGSVKTKKIDPTTYPFEEYVIDAVIKKAKENLRVISLFNGVYNASGNTPSAVFDGVKTQLLAAIAAGDVPAGNVVEVAAINGTNAVAQFEKAIAVIPDQYFYSDVVCVVSRKLKTAYETDYRSKFGSLPYNSSTEKGFIDGTNIEFVVEPGLTTFERPIFTTRGNLCYLYDDEGKKDNLDFDYDKRTRNLAYIMDFQSAVGIAIAELVWTTSIQA